MYKLNNLFEAANEYANDPTVLAEDWINYYADEDIITDILEELELDSEEQAAQDEGLIEIDEDFDAETLDMLIIAIHNRECEDKRLHNEAIIDDFMNL